MATLTVGSDQPYKTLQEAVNAASTTEATTIVVSAGTYNEDITLDARTMEQKANITFVAAEGADVTFTGKFTIGYYEKRVGAKKWDADVTFENITFDQANAATHSIDIQQCNDFTMTNCKVIGDGEYGILGTNVDNGATISGCTFENAGIQSAGNFGTNLVIDDCTFDDSKVNIQSGNSVDITNCTFNSTVKDVNVGDSFYCIRSNDNAINIENTTFNIDSELTEAAADQAKWGVLWQRNAGGTKWNAENIEVNYTEAAMAQGELLFNKNGTTTAVNTEDRIVINGLTSESNNVSDILAKSESALNVIDNGTYTKYDNGEVVETFVSDTIYVSDKFTKDNVGEGMLFGFNAFADVNDAAAAAEAAAGKLVIAEGANVTYNANQWFLLNAPQKEIEPGVWNYDVKVDASETYDLQVDGTISAYQLLLNNAETTVSATGKLFASGEVLRVMGGTLSVEGNREANAADPDEIFTGSWGGGTRPGADTQVKGGYMQINQGAVAEFNNTVVFVNAGWMNFDDATAEFNNTYIYLGSGGSYAPIAVEVKNGSEVAFAENTTIINDTEFTMNITVDATSTLTMDASSSITATTLTVAEGGKFIIDAADFEGFKKVVDLSGETSLEGKVSIANGDDVSVIYGADGDVTLVNVDTSVLYVDATFTGEFGDMVGEGMYLGINAFADFDDAVNALKDNDATIVLLSDAAMTADPAFKLNVISGDGKDHTLKIDSVIDVDAEFAKEINIDAGLFAAYYNNHNVIVNGDLKGGFYNYTGSLTFNNSKITNSYDNSNIGGVVNINGDGTWTVDNPQADNLMFLNVGRNDWLGQGILNLNDTVVKAIQFSIDSNSANAKSQINAVNSTICTVLNDGAFGNMIVGANGELNLTDSNLYVVGTLTNNGTVTVKGESTVNVNKMSGNAIQVLEGATLTDSVIGGESEVVLIGNASVKNSKIYAIGGEEGADGNVTMNISDTDAEQIIGVGWVPGNVLDGNLQVNLENTDCSVMTAGSRTFNGSVEFNINDNSSVNLLYIGLSAAFNKGVSINVADSYVALISASNAISIPGGEYNIALNNAHIGQFEYSNGIKADEISIGGTTTVDNALFGAELISVTENSTLTANSVAIDTDDQMNISGATVIVNEIVNNGEVNITGESTVVIEKQTGTININDGAVMTDSKVGNVNVYGNNTWQGNNTIGAMSIGYNNSGSNIVTNITGTATVSNFMVGNVEGFTSTLNIGTADGERTTINGNQHNYATNSIVNVVNADVTGNYVSMTGNINITDSTYSKFGDFRVVAGRNHTINPEVTFTRSTINGAYGYIGGWSASDSGYGILVLNDNSEWKSSGGSLSTAKSEITINDSKFTVGGTFTHNGSLTVDADSLVSAKTLTGSGSITIDATGFDGGVKTIVDVDKSTFTGNIDVIGSEFGKIYRNDEGDVILSVVDTATLYVDSAWDYDLSEEFEEGKYFGVNAFASIDDAVKAADASVSKIIAAAGKDATLHLDVFTENANGLIIDMGNNDLSFDSNGDYVFKGSYDLTGAVGAEIGYCANELTIGKNVTVNADVLWANDNTRNIEGTLNVNAVYVRDQAVNVSGTLAVRDNYVVLPPVNGKVATNITESGIFKAANVYVKGEAYDFNIDGKAAVGNFNSQSIVNVDGELSITESAAIAELNLNGVANLSDGVKFNGNLINNGTLNIAGSAFIENLVNNVELSLADKVLAAGTLVNEGIITVNNATLTGASIVNNGTITVTGESTLSASFSGTAVSVAASAVLNVVNYTFAAGEALINANVYVNQIKSVNGLEVVKYAGSTGNIYFYIDKEDSNIIYELTQAGQNVVVDELGALDDQIDVTITDDGAYTYTIVAEYNGAAEYTLTINGEIIESNSNGIFTWSGDYAAAYESSFSYNVTVKDIFGREYSTAGTQEVVDVTAPTVSEIVVDTAVVAGVSKNTLNFTVSDNDEGVKVYLNGEYVGGKGEYSLEVSEGIYTVEVKDSNGANNFVYSGLIENPVDTNSNGDITISNDSATSEQNKVVIDSGIVTGGDNKDGEIIVDSYTGVEVNGDIKSSNSQSNTIVVGTSAELDVSNNNISDVTGFESGAGAVVKANNYSATADVDSFYLGMNGTASFAAVDMQTGDDEIYIGYAAKFEAASVAGTETIKVSRNGIFAATGAVGDVNSLTVGTDAVFSAGTLTGTAGDDILTFNGNRYAVIGAVDLKGGADTLALKNGANVIFTGSFEAADLTITGNKTCTIFVTGEADFSDAAGAKRVNIVEADMSGDGEIAAGVFELFTLDADSELKFSIGTGVKVEAYDLNAHCWVSDFDEFSFSGADYSLVKLSSLDGELKNYTLA